MGIKKKQNIEISIIGEISKIISDSISPESTMEKIAKLISRKFKLDVCSIYLIDSLKKSLVLCATIGLSEKSVSNIHMSINEGLTGLVMEKMSPVFVINPSKHPRYKFFKNSGEEHYKTFLGVPLVYHQKALGALVVQSVSKTAIEESDIGFFSTIASQISSTAAYAGLLEKFEQEKTQSKVLQNRLTDITEKSNIKKKRKVLIKGVPVSGGIGEGYAHYFGESIGFDEVDRENTDDIDTEIKRLKNAFRDSINEMERLIQSFTHISDEDKSILNIHQMMLKDEVFKKKIFELVEKGFIAEYALKKVVKGYVEAFSDMNDPYLKERSRDIEDAGKNLLRSLLGVGSSTKKKFTKDTIIIASNISPADIVALRQKHLKAIILTKGGRTSHTAIIAKSLEITMVVSVRDIVDTVKEDDFLIIDGTSGVVYIRPTEEIIKEYKRLKEEKTKYDSCLSDLKDLPAITEDGAAIMLDANIGLLSDIDLADKYGASDIGLYRTEFPFLIRTKLPSEDEQFELYKKIVEGVDGKEVNIRTLDVGGDKFLSYLDYPKEDNPYLGWRSIRVSLELDKIFRTQLRAILRASSYGRVKLMFPMITSVSEIKSITAILNEEKMFLKNKKVSFDQNLKIGIMVEVPAAVRILDSLLKYIDFVSIGTNDLIQYSLAVDRNNPKVASIYNPLHPAMILTIYEIIKTCKKHGKSVSICGESASNPRCACLFFAMGADRLSMNSASIPVIKSMIRGIKLSDAKKNLKKVFKMEEAGEITDYMDEVLSL